MNEEREETKTPRNLAKEGLANAAESAETAKDGLSGEQTPEAAEAAAAGETPAAKTGGWEKPDWYGDAADNAAKARAALRKAGLPWAAGGKAQADDAETAGEHALETVRRAAAGQDTPTENAGAAAAAENAGKPEKTEPAAGIADAGERQAREDAAEDERVNADRAERDKAWRDNYADYSGAYQPQVSAIRELIARDAAESAEEREKREKRERSRRIVAAATDGLRALSNLYFVNQYAPNHYDYAKGGLTPKEEERQSAAAKERRARADRRSSALIKLGDLLQGRAQGLAGLLAARDKAAEARAAADAARDKNRRERDLQPDKLRKGAAEADKAAADASAAKTKAKYEPERQRAKIGLDNSNAKKARQQGAAALAKASGSGSGQPQEFAAWDSAAHGGKKHYFKTAAAAERHAKREGTWHEETAEKTRQAIDKYGRVQTLRATEPTGYPVSPEEMEQIAEREEAGRAAYSYTAPLADSLDDRGRYDADAEKPKAAKPAKKSEPAKKKRPY